eukprot:669849-Pyramimonas_sp.AAC.1
MVSGQWGFRQDRSTMGPILISRTVFELLAGAKPLRSWAEPKTDVALIMADARTAHPRVARSGMGAVLERSGLPARCAR